jgi:hypothetical protein
VSSKNIFMTGTCYITPSANVVISLIKQDLICNKLVLGLSELGLEAGKYHLDIGTIVLKLMGCAEPDDALLEVYFNYMEKARTVNDVEENRDVLDVMAQELYGLLAERLKGSEQPNNKEE